MALKPTIYKFTLAISDLDRHYYDTLSLTVAQHPSETEERMVARVMALCFEAGEELQFTQGLSTPDEPDAWVKALDDQILHWLDVGEPGLDRIKKASRQAKRTSVYSFNSKSDVWWKQESGGFSRLPVAVYRFSWNAIEALASNLERSVHASITISEETAFVTFDQSKSNDLAIELRRETLQSN